MAERRGRSILGLDLDLALKGRRDEALTHFRWVRDRGDALSTAYTIAVAELERMEKAGAKLPTKGN